MNLEMQGRRILVCDSDRTVLELLQIRLGIVGCHTFLTRTGHTALETIRTARPQAMLLELNLPEMTGFEVLQALNPRGEGIPFPVLIMGKKLGAEDIQRAVRLGARDVLIKPFSGADVVERVARQFRRSAPGARPLPAGVLGSGQAGRETLVSSTLI